MISILVGTTEAWFPGHVQHFRNSLEGETCRITAGSSKALLDPRPDAQLRWVRADHCPIPLGADRTPDRILSRHGRCPIISYSGCDWIAKSGSRTWHLKG